MPIPSERRYAESTKVSVERTLETIKKDLMRFGGTGFMQAEVPGQVALMFILNYEQENELRIKFTMKAPKFEEFKLMRNGQTRKPAEQQKAYEQERQRIWRALAASIKGKLLAVEEEIETIEQAFWGNVLTPSGQTVYEETRAAVHEASRRGLMPAVPLLALPEGRGK